MEERPPGPPGWSMCRPGNARKVSTIVVANSFREETTEVIAVWVPNAHGGSTASNSYGGSVTTSSASGPAIPPPAGGGEVSAAFVSGCAASSAMDATNHLEKAVCRHDWRRKRITKGRFKTGGRTNGIAQVQIPRSVPRGLRPDNPGAPRGQSSPAARGGA
jgi:hypothetical protein